MKSGEPAIFIGLGGTGEQILAKIKTRLREESPGPDPYSFLCIDCDEPRSSHHKGPIPPLSFAEFLNIGFYYPAFIEKACEQDDTLKEWWFDCKEWQTFLRTSEIGTYTDHRSGTLLFSNLNRRIRRVCLYHDLSRGFVMPRLQEIRASHAGGSSPQPLIAVFASLCGAAGSGLFLDTGYLLRSLMPGAKILGILVLPELYPWIDDARFSIYFKANAYATIREIEHFAKNNYTFGTTDNPVSFDAIDPFHEYWIAGIEEGSAQTLDTYDYVNRIQTAIVDEVLLTRSLGKRAAPLPLSERIPQWETWKQACDELLQRGTVYSPYISREFD